MDERTNEAATGAPMPASAGTVVAQRIATLTKGYSLEVSSRSARDLDACLTHVERGSEVYINYIAGDELSAKARCAAVLRARGLCPVPHIAARHVRSLAQLDDHLQRLAGEAGVDRVLLIAGDVAKPAGPFESSIAVLATGLLPKYDFRAVGFAGYPEGHPKIADAMLKRSLADKLALAADQSLESYIVTQFSFELAHVTQWLSALRRNGVVAPVRIGLAGPASVATLVRYAIRCGVTNSLRAFTSRTGAFVRLISDSAPDVLIRGLAESAAPASLVGMTGLHFFPFGGVAKSARWANAVKQQRLRLTPDNGFKVRDFIDASEVRDG